MHDDIDPNGGTESAADGFINMLLNSDFGAPSGGWETSLFVLLLTFIIGQTIGWVYMYTHRVLSYSQTYVASLVVLPVLIGMMMMLMAGSMMVAFGLLAVFAVVRFRNVLKDTRDTTFVLWAIMEGLAVGTLRFTTAVIACIGVSLVFGYLRTTSFGSRHRFDAILSLQMTGDLVTGISKLKDVLHNHCLRSQVASERRLSDEGIDLSYRLLMRDPMRSDELEWALKQTEGFEGISLFLRGDESEI